MKMVKKAYKYLVLTAIFGMVISCEEDFDHEVSSDLTSQSAGSADFTRFVSLGNSLTAGYANGTVYLSGQENSYPVMLAERFKQATSTMEEFMVPYVKDEIGGLLLGGTQIANTKLILNSSLSPENISGMPTTDITSGIGSQGPYGNMGVPGAKSYHLLADGYGSIAGVSQGLANPYYAYFATNETTSVFADALSQSPTFFTLWIGNNDVLSYSTEGGDEAGVDQTGNMDPSTYGSNDISDPNVVIGSIQTMVNGLVSSGAKGLVANIPNVTSIPYFTAVPYNALTEEALIAGTGDLDIINTLNTNFAALNQVFDAIAQPDRKISFTSGANPVVIKDTSLTDLSQTITNVLVQGGLDQATAILVGTLYGQARQATFNDLMLLTSSSVIGQPNSSAVEAGIPADFAINGVTYPLEGKYVLTETEVAKVQAATDAYNTGITQVVANYPEVYMVDMNAAMEQLSSTGFVYDGIQYTDAYVTGSSFSLDGVHPTPKGYAIVANYFIRAINENFGSTLLELNPNAYPGL